MPKIIYSNLFINKVKEISISSAAFHARRLHALSYFDPNKPGAESSSLHKGGWQSLKELLKLSTTDIWGQMVLRFGGGQRAALYITKC